MRNFFKKKIREILACPLPRLLHVQPAGREDIQLRGLPSTRPGSPYDGGTPGLGIM